ncbi:MAG: methylenetetrahydrofolate reductase [Candidatus Peribacteraceae bacterium]|nr:methylenetetrahydrofolate reductase [Candidatus Peribacteraceae bacterium]
MLDLKNFPVTVELASLAGSDVAGVIEEAQKLQADAFNIPDGILGRLTIDPITLAFRVHAATGTPTIAHLTCRDSTVLGLAQKILAAGNLGVDGVLALSGDAAAKNVFEIRAPGLVKLIADLNNGEFNAKPIKSPTKIQIAVAANPNVDGQIDYLKEKEAAGAQFVQTQPVFDLETATKFLDEAKQAGIKIPILLGIMPLKSLKVAEYFNEKVHGVTIPQSVLQRLAEDENCGAELAIELLGELKDRLDGVHIMPLGIAESANKIFDFLKNKNPA